MQACAGACRCACRYAQVRAFRCTCVRAFRCTGVHADGVPVSRWGAGVGAYRMYRGGVCVYADGVRRWGTSVSENSVRAAEARTVYQLHTITKSVLTGYLETPVYNIINHSRIVSHHGHHHALRLR